MYSAPQGSVLGPILFAMYTPFSNIIANHFVNHQLFADDTQLQKPAPLSDQTHQRIQSMHRQQKSMDNRKSAQTEQRQNRSSSLSLFVFLETFYRLPPWLGYSWLSQHPLLWFCQEPWIHSWLKLSMKKHIINICQTVYFKLKRISAVRRFLTEDTAKTLVTSYILSRFDCSNCLLMGTPNSVIQPLQKIQNVAARLILSAPRHHHSTSLLENCTGFSFQNVLSRLNVFQCYKWGFFLLASLKCYISTLHLVYYALVLTLACWKSNNTNTRLMAFSPSLALDPTFGIHSHKTANTTLSSFKAKLKIFHFSQYFRPN